MASVALYKVLMLILVAGIPTSVGASSYYYQQQTNTLNNHISDLANQVNSTSRDLSGLNSQLNSANDQVSSLNNQVSNLNGQVSQLQSQNLQLQNQVTSLQSHLASLNGNASTTIVSKGQITLTSNNGFQIVSFTVPPETVDKINVTFSTSSQGCLGALPISAPCSLGVSLFNQTQFKALNACNCILYGNYTASTWSSPIATSYTAQLVVSSPGLWDLAFYPEPGATTTLMVLVNDSVLLVGPVSLTTQKTLISSGSLSLVGYGAADYVTFTAPLGVLSSSLNVSFSVGGNGPSIIVALLNQAQYNAFVKCKCVFYGNYTTTTWMSPTAQGYTVPIAIPSPGAWYFAFMEVPGTGSGLTITETLTLVSTSS